MLALGSFGLVARGVAQDRVYLQSLTDIYTTKDRSQDGPDDNGSTFIRDTLNKVSYTRGVGLTNEYRSFQVNATTPSTPPPGEELWWTGGYFSLSAVTNVMVNPWVTASQWLGEGTFTDTQCSSNFSYQGGTIYTNDTSNTVVSACGSYFNEQTPYKGAAYATEYVSSNYWGTTVIGTNTNNTTTEIKSVVMLDTDTNGTGSALYKLTSGFGIPDYTNGSAVANSASKYEFAGLTPDTNGAVWKVFPVGSTGNDISVTIKPTYTNEITKFTYNPTPQRMPVGLEWKSPNDSAADENWSSYSNLYVLKGATVDFRVTAGGSTNIIWPTNTPTWIGDGGSGTGSTFSITFNTLSGDTNGQPVIVTAGSKAEIRVVVFDYEVVFQPDGKGVFEGRATNTTRFGVGEKVKFFTKFDPPGINGNAAGPFDWTVTGMSTDGVEEDRSNWPSGLAWLEAGAFPETNTVTATIRIGPSEGKSRTNQFVVVKPTDAFLKDLKFIVTNAVLEGQVFIYTTDLLITNPIVIHMSNTMSCGKKSAYFLEPRDVSFHGVQVREGAGPTTWEPGNTNTFVQMITNSSGLELFWITNSGLAIGDHVPWLVFCDVRHPKHNATGLVEPNYFAIDHFSYPLLTTSTNLPVLADHAAQLVTQFNRTIAVEYTFKTTNVHGFTTVLSERELYTTGRITIRKARSGPHTKEFSDPDSYE